jgi:hypothetical protein
MQLMLDVLAAIKKILDTNRVNVLAQAPPLICLLRACAVATSTWR